MRCPYCNTNYDKVIDSRSSKGGKNIRRRRECIKCKSRFTTYEYIEEIPLMVVKKDNRREPFDRKKLMDGITIACTKLPIPTDRIDEIVENITRDIESRGEREISSRDIGEMVMAHLQKLHDVAFVRFASVYRKFQDKTEFLKELNNIHE